MSDYIKSTDGAYYSSDSPELGEDRPYKRSKLNNDSEHINQISDSFDNLEQVLSSLFKNHIIKFHLGITR